MIQLYDRDAAVVADALDIIANWKQAFEGEDLTRGGDTYNRGLGAAHQRMVDWEPMDTVTGVSAGRKQALVNARLKSIIAAINEQSGP